MRWDDMSMSQKSEAIGLMVRNGVTDIDTMRQMWDDMDGRKKKELPPFAKRFEENPPRTIPTSQGNATHFMGADEADGRYYAYPTVQPMDYRDKSSHLKYYGDRAFDRALENNDVMEFPTLDEAINYSENYKRPPSTGAYLNNELHPLYSPYDYVRSFADGGSPDDPPYWGQPTSQPQGPLDYLNRYVRSKAFERRSPDADYLNTARQNVDSFDMVYNDPAPKRIKYSPFYSNHMIQMYPGGRETPYAPYNDTIQVPYMAVLAHEYGHNIDPYFESTRDIPENWMDMYERQSSEANEHDARPQEIYADLQSLRYQLYEKNIYDIIKDGAFNEKHLEKALKQNIPNRLLQTMPKETIIEMMNTIADNSQPTGNVQDAYILPTDVGLGYV